MTLSRMFKKPINYMLALSVVLWVYLLGFTHADKTPYRDKILFGNICNATLEIFEELKLHAGFASLALAIVDLTNEYPGNYPAEFLITLRNFEYELLQLALENEETIGDNQGNGSNGRISEKLEDFKDRFGLFRKEALIANPLVSNQPLLYVVRHQYQPDHHNTHNFFPGAEHEYNDGRFSPGGALKTIDFKNGGEVTVLTETADGVIRDPEVHWNGEKIVFSMRRNLGDSYHIYEINADGTGLKQLTFLRDTDDMDPLYLPDNSIVFSSTREPKYVMCNRHIGANIYRMDHDGANIHQITKNTLFDRPTDILPDGRILYDRWEYVDRNFGDAQSLWTVNPDGTNQAIYWGNNTPAPGAVIDARLIPGTQNVISVFSSTHDRPWGALAIIDRRIGMDGHQPVLRTWPDNALERVRDPGTANDAWDDFVGVRPKYEDPYPLNDKYFLATRMTGEGESTGIYLLDVFGNEILLHAEEPGCFDPLPLASRKRPVSIPSRRNFDNREGTFYVQDVYQGTHMEGIHRGTIKYLRVVETPEKRYWSTSPASDWSAQGRQNPGVNWHSFEVKLIHGTVPVEKDGSAFFSVPSDRFVYFQLLDERGMMVQSMRSGTVVQSGETTGCIGCHEDRLTAPLVKGMPLALQKDPVKLNGWYGEPRQFGYMAEVQPVFDRNCVSCHDFGLPAGEKLNLAPDRNLIFNTSYNELWRKGYIDVVGGGPAEIKQARSWGSHASELTRVLLNEHESHDEVQLTREEFERIATWIDLNAVFYPCYASSYHYNPGGRSPITAAGVNRLSELTGRSLERQFSHVSNKGPLVSFDRPELSPVLREFSDASDPGYIEALEIIESGKRTFAINPDVDMEGFELSGIDLWREEKYQHRLQIELKYRESIRKGLKTYDSEFAGGDE
jgi:hypothetical protein